MNTLTNNELECLLCGLNSQDTDCTIINPENDQKLLYGQTVCADCQKEDNKERFFAMTNEYYDWTSPTRRLHDSLVDLWKEDMYDSEHIAGELEYYLQSARQCGIAESDAKIRFNSIKEEIGQFV